MKAAVVTVLMVVAWCASASAQTTTERILLNENPVIRVTSGTEGEEVSNPPFKLRAVTMRRSGAVYVIRARFDSDPSNLAVTFQLDPPGSAGQRVTARWTRASTAGSVEGNDVVIEVPSRGLISWDWSLVVKAEGSEGGARLLTRTPQVPVSSLTGEGPAPEEVRAWRTGVSRRGSAWDYGEPCSPAKPAVIDGFRAELVRDKIVFTLHMAATPGKVDRFEGAPVRSQLTLIRLAPDGERFTGAIAFDSARKTATYLDIGSSPPKAHSQLKIDVLGQNVLLKSAWRAGGSDPAFNADRTLGSLPASTLVQVTSTLETTESSCVVSTASVPFDVLDPDAKASPTPSALPGERTGAPPYLGLIMAFGGIAAIVALVTLSSRRARRAQAASAAGTGND